MSEAPVSTEASLPGRGLKFLDSLRRHPRAVIVVFLAVLVLGIPVALIMGVPMYSTGATVQVSPRFMKTLRDDIELEFQSNTQYLQFIQQQIRTLTRHDVLESALRQLDARFAGQVHPWRLEGESERRSIYRLQRGLRAFHVRDSYLIQVMLDSPQAEGIEDVVNAVVEAYLTVARGEHIFGADQRVEQLEQREAGLLASIEQLTAERTLIAQTLGVTAFNPNDINPFDRQMQKLLEEHTDARTRRIEADTGLAAFLAQGETDMAMRSISESILSDPGLNSLKASLNQRRATLLTAISGLAKNHPARLDANDELASIETEIATRERALRAQLAEAIEKRYRNAAEQAQVIEAALARTIDEVSLRSREYAERFNLAVGLNNHIQLQWNELDRVRDRLNFFEAEEASPGFVRLVTPAMSPLYPTGTGKRKLLILVLMAAGGLALLMPILIDLFDRRIRTANEAHRLLGFAPMGWVIDHTGLASSEPTAAFVDEQLRRIAAALIRDRDRHGTRSLAFTSVKPGGGTTWLIRALTATLNQLGYRALAVEANAYHPDPAYRPENIAEASPPIAGADADAPAQAVAAASLSALLADPGRAIAPDRRDPRVPSLHVGARPGQSSLAGLMHLPEALARLTDHDFVLVDAPPLLTCADAEMIVRGCDGGLLVVGAGQISKGELGRAVRLLQRVDPKVAGAIVNRIQPFHGGGYVAELMSEHAERRRIASPAIGRELVAAVGAVLREARHLAGAVLLSPFTLTRRLFGKAGEH